MPPEDRTATPQAVDHVATFVMRVGRSLYRRDVVTRSGNWISSDRTQDGRTTTHYSHVVSGTSFSLSRSADGRVEAIRVARDRSDAPYYRMHRSATGRSDRLLGERCRIWRIAPAGDLAGDREWQSCETADGIQLWLREQWRDTGQSLSVSRAVAVSRRTIAPAAARPPADFFAIGALPPGPVWSEPGQDYRVVLQSTSVDGGGPGRKIIQSRGAFHSSDIQNDDGSRNLSIGQGTFRIFYWQEPGGRPIALWVNRLPDEDNFNIPAGEQVRVEGRDPETILGETCTWMRSTILVSHYRQMQCETADGIVLSTDEQSMAGHTIYRAVSISREHLSPSDFRLPDRALSPSGWGVTAD